MIQRPWEKLAFLFLVLAIAFALHWQVAGPGASWNRSLMFLPSGRMVRYHGDDYAFFRNRPGRGIHVVMTPSASWQGMGLLYARGPATDTWVPGGGSSAKCHVLLVSGWLPVLFAGGLFLLCWSMHMRTRTKHEGRHLCGHCGYDLRATPDRCPECGQPSPATTPRPAGDV